MKVSKYTYTLTSRRETIDGGNLTVLAKSKEKADAQIIALADDMEITSAKLKSIKSTKHQPRISQ
jgi:hypothetical protein